MNLKTLQYYGLDLYFWILDDRVCTYLKINTVNDVMLMRQNEESSLHGEAAAAQVR